MIRVENLNYTYPGANTPTLSGLSFDIKDGEVFGLLGPSGAGKSTTQKILMGLLTGFDGTAEVLGAPVGTLGRSFYEKIGVSFELPTLYLRLTAAENLHLFASLYDGPTADVHEILALVDLADEADKRVEAFSKGMKMRLNLCRALLHDPQILFLDEPTTGQDPARARMTRDLILRLKSEGKTIFLTTHNMAEADEVCDRVAFLTGGHIPVLGVPADLKRQYGRRELLATTVNGPHHFPMEGLGTNEAFMDILKTDQIVSLHTQEASLDDVFIKATEHV